MRANKRDELVRNALDVFYRDGFHSTGMDKLVVETGVSKTSMYKHFRTKDDLILAALRLRDENFRNWLCRRIEELAGRPRDQLLAAFDALAEWIAQPEFRGCMFIKASAEFQEKDHPVHMQSAAHKKMLLDHVTGIAKRAGAPEPERLASQLMLLKEGAIVTAVMGYGQDPSGDAKRAAETLIDQAVPRNA